MSVTMSCAIKANYSIWQNWISHTTNIRSVHSRLVYNRSGEWRDETMPILASTTVGFSYVTFLLVKLANVSRLVHWSVKTYNLTNLTLFADLSTFPHIFGPAAESLLGSQGTVWKNNPAIDLLLWCFQSKVRFIEVSVLHRWGCWLHCSPLSLVSFLSMTYGETSGTFCLRHCRFVYS